MGDVNYIYCGNHFAINTYIKSLCCTPKSSKLYLNEKNEICLFKLTMAILFGDSLMKIC